jgi:hypothetical protein
MKHCPCCPHAARKRKRPNGAGSLFYDSAKRRWVAAMLIPGVKRICVYAKSREAAADELVRLQARRLQTLRLTA